MDFGSVLPLNNSSIANFIAQEEMSSAVCVNNSATTTVAPMNKRRGLTPEEKAESVRLKAIYEDRKAAWKARGIRLTQTDVAEQCGWSGQSAFSQYATGKIPLNLDALLLLSRALEFRLEEVSPRLAKEVAGISDATHSSSLYPRTPSEADFVLIPQLSVVGECGDGHLNGHIEIEGGLAFRRDWLTKLSVKPEHCRALYAEGASMEPYIFEDDIVLVDTSDRLPKDRTPYAIRRADGGISFKRLIRQLSGTWLLRSDNPDKAMYPDEEVSATAMHDIPIIGRIIWRGGQM